MCEISRGSELGFAAGVSAS